MIALALRSLRHRRMAFLATFVTVALGTALIGSFATLVETATGAVSDADTETLITVGGVVGAWGSAIVLFSVAATVGLTVEQRAAEVGLLRTLGATPRQVRRSVRAEVLVLALAASVLGAVLALVVGGLLLAAMAESGMVADDIAFGGGPVSVGVVAGAMVALSLLAASIAGRRATRGPARGVLAGAGAERGRVRWWRVLAAVVLVGQGVAMAVVTLTVTRHSEDPFAAMQTSGSASIVAGLGLALLAPVLVRVAAVLLTGIGVGRGRAGGLALANARRRPHLLAGVLAPVIVLVSVAAGVLMLVSIDGRTLQRYAVDPEAAEVAETITLLNNVVVGMICLFAAITVVNSFVVVISRRRLELARLRLLGADPGQVRASVLAEAALVAGVGVVAGLLASLATVVPFAVARDEGVVPDGDLWLVPLVAVAALLLTLGSARGAVARALPTSASPAEALR